MELGLREYIDIIRKRLWLVIAFVLVATITTGLLSYLVIKPTYEASTKLVVNKPVERVDGQMDVGSVQTNIMLIGTYKEVIKSPRIMDKVVQQYPQLNLTSKKLIDKVAVNSVNNTQVISIVVQDDSYERASQLANAVTKVFQTEITSIMKVDNVQILNTANEDGQAVPVKPNKKLNIAISFVVSLMIAVGIIFLLEYLDDSIKNEADVEKFLELPTLGVISRISDEDLVDKRSTAVNRQAGESKHVTVNQ